MITLIIILLILWALGLVAHVGAFINFLLIVALVLFIVRMAQGSPRPRV